MIGRQARGDGPSVIVIGAGIFGASTANELAARGWRVTLVERYGAGNWRSSSGDISRLLRFAHFPGTGNEEWYTRSAWLARELWFALAQEEGRDLLVNTGAMWFCDETTGAAASVAEQTLHELGIPCQRVPPSELSGHFPSLRSDDLAFGLFEPDACVLRAAESVRVLVQRAERNGAQVVLGAALPHPEGVLVDGTVMRSDREIWACGAWLGPLFPDWAPVTATRQQVFYWDTPPEWRRGPAWLEGADDFYGFPDVDGAGIKALSDRIGPPIDLERTDRTADPDEASRVQRYLSHRFPALRDTPVLRSYAMHYEVAPGRNFLIGPLPGQDRVWLLGGGSGHGFKHAPALARYVANVLEGAEELDRHFAIGEGGGG